jgi:hypothetical protein
MTEIPFINQLGDAFDAAIADRVHARAPRRFGRGALVLVTAAFALGVAAIALARVLSSPDELATRGIACYAAPDLGSNVTVVPNGGPPVQTCANAFRRMGLSVPALVACAAESTVAVVPGLDASVCTRLHLQALPASYETSRARTAQLNRSVLAIEAEHDCVAPSELAARVQLLLNKSGWSGWKTVVQSSPAGRCGTVSNLDGVGQRSIDGALDASQRVVLVTGSAARSTMTLLYGPNGLAPALQNESGTRCFTVPALEALVVTRVAATGRSGRLETRPALASGTSLAGSRGDRYDAGCAVLTEVRSASDGWNVVAVAPRPRSR